MPLLVLDFQETNFAQSFANKLTNEYSGAINGQSTFQDCYDLFFDSEKGWTSKHWIQKISLPKFDEKIVERVNFSVHFDLKFMLLNYIIRGYTNQGLFHRYACQIP